MCGGKRDGIKSISKGGVVGKQTEHSTVKAFMFKITARCKYKRGKRNPGSRLHVQSKLTEACYPIRGPLSLSVSLRYPKQERGGGRNFQMFYSPPLPLLISPFLPLICPAFTVYPCPKSEPIHVLHFPG